MKMKKFVTLTAGIATAAGIAYAASQRRPNVCVSLTDVDGFTIDLPLSAATALDLRVAATDVRRAFEAGEPIDTPVTDDTPSAADTPSGADS
jgi:hypothetical protein